MSTDTRRSARTAPAKPTALPQPSAAEQLNETRELLWEVSQSTHDAPQSDLHTLTNLLLSLVDVLQQWQDDPEVPADDARPLSQFIADCLTTVRAAAGDPESSSPRIRQWVDQATQRWGDLLAGDADAGYDAAAIERWDDDQGDLAAADAVLSDEVLPAPSDDEISRILAQLTDSLEASSLAPEPTPPADRPPADRPPADRPPADQPPALDDDGEMNDELREAFLDDAGRCLGAMEEALLAYEAHPKDRRPLQQICRELHTLKGASGSVGLSELADYLHGVEDRLRDSSETQTPSIDSLFQNLDTIRSRVARIGRPLATSMGAGASGCDAAERDCVGETAAAALPSFAVCDEGGGDEESLRVKPAQLNRLMDMLAELVMLRNRRDCELAELKEIHRELLHSVSRLRIFSDRCDSGEGGGSRIADRGPLSDDSRPLPRLSEVAGDVLEAAQRLRASYQPVAEGNVAVSQFIRQFRQELVSLRRMPVSGLFRRLQRVASDAARAEGKQVRLSLLGEDAGIERSLQQRLYEPLLHIIRNAVSHGIEQQEQRARHGKPPVGRITLEARTGPDLLVIEIRDDGRGLDYDALRRRGLELGLLTAHTAARQEELSQLIFHPGFSTRQAASQVAGRGVGMDVVASTIHRMRGWVEVDSVTGQGTTFRLTFPLPSVIQHTMAFRSAGQTFALPMQFVQAAGDRDTELPTLRFSDWVDPQAAEPTELADAKSPVQSLVIGCERSTTDNPQTPGRRFRLLVDQILGPEEVVVRPLPALLKHHPFCSGATLSGTGDVVLVLDNHRFVESAAAKASAPSPTAREIAERASNRPSAATRVLVVDDSLSARKRVVRCLQHCNIETVEAADGEEACELLRKESFAAVFSDLEMPRLDGLGLLAEIRAGHCGPPIPLVIISSRTEQPFRDRAAALGVSGYLPKPVSHAAIQEALRNIPSLCSVDPVLHTGQQHARRGDSE